MEWLTNGYHDKKNVERDRDSGILSQKQAEALLGVHKRRESLAAEPSKGDIDLLKQVYGMEIITFSKAIAIQSSTECKTLGMSQNPSEPLIRMRKYVRVWSMSEPTCQK